MLSRFANTLFLLTTLAATTAAAQQAVVEPTPHLSVMSHQKMTYNDKVIYEADVDLADPKPKMVSLQVAIDGFTWTCHTAVRNVAAQADEQRSGKKVLSAHQVSCVVTELSADGAAKADIVYTIYDSAHNVNKSGHVNANLQVGKEYKTTNSGSQVTLLLQRQ